ncbi:Pyruvate carboxyltransferase [Senna tora]|uniref:Pyruvate carboxyltransferase n=1 Tax=Senna tora TaxID=362788 RepID=A0A834WIH1_9FABA|nr:Pyruvate carboxyltransferase [Senna tora]
MLRLTIVLQIKGFTCRLSRISLHMQYEYTSVELSGFELLPDSSTAIGLLGLMVELVKEQFGKDWIELYITALQQQVGDYVQDVTVSATEASLRNELEDLLDKEELLWAQKSHQMCLVQGDRNTKYFHTLVKKRRVKNRISRIKLDSGEWSQSYSEMESVVVDYFSNVFFDGS